MLSSPGEWRGVDVVLSQLDNLLKRLSSLGLPDDLSGEDLRRQQLTNLFVLLVSMFCFGFSAWYAAVDWQNLMPISIWAFCTGVLLLPTPLFHRLGSLYALIYFTFVICVGFTGIAYMSGSAANAHYNLLAAPAAVLLTGSHRPAAAFLIMSCFVGTFLLIDLAMPVAGSVASMAPEIGQFNKVLSIWVAAVIAFWAILHSLRTARAASDALEREHERSETLLLNLMPASIAERLKVSPDQIIADQFDSVTILFADIVDFTPRADRLSPDEIVKFLNRVFSEFDKLAEKYGVEKIKTIGDAYMVAGGMPEPRDGHVYSVAEMALEMLEVTRRMSDEFGEEIAVRIGIHTGPAVAGVIGTRKLFYDVWGDTVNTASRMESHGSAGKVQVTRSAFEKLSPRYQLVPRGRVPVKGKGEMELFYLLGR